MSSPIDDHIKLQLEEKIDDLEQQLALLIDWAMTNNPIDGRKKWNALPEHIQDQISPCPYSKEDSK